MEHSKVGKCDAFSILLSSEWLLLLLLPYLKVNETAILDSSICNQNRRQFLICLSSALNEINLDNLISHESDAHRINTKDMIDWLVIRKINVTEFCSTYYLQRENKFLSNTSISKLTANSPNMKKLTLLIPMRWDDQQLVLEIKCCNLESVTMYGESLVIPQLLANNRYLKSLSLSIENDVPSELFSVIGTYCPLLEEFSLRLVRSESPLSLFDYQIEIFSRGCTNLKSLKIKNLDVGETNMLVEHLGKFCHFLELLDISFCYDTYSEDYLEHEIDIILEPLTILKPFEDLSRGCQFLKHILFEFYTISANILATFINIEKLSFRNCEISNNGYSEIGKLSKLKSLEFRIMEYMIDQSITNIFLVKRYIDLESFTICNDSIFSDDDLLCILANCPCLKKMEILNQGTVTEKGFLTQHRCLEELNVTLCQKISCNGLLNFVLNFPNLRKISITRIGNVIEVEALWELFNKCQKLVHITNDVDVWSNTPTSLVPNDLKIALNKRKALLLSIS